MPDVKSLLLSLVISAVLIMVIPLLYAIRVSRKNRALEKRTKVIVCVINCIFWIIVDVFISRSVSSSAAPAIWSSVAYFLMTPLYEAIPSKR